MTLTVLEPGVLTTVQDRGRPGLAHLGVPRAGALDRPAADLANRLVGNPEDAGLLETTVTGVVLRCDRSVTLAVTGARCEVRVEGRSVAHTEPLSVRAGAVVSIGRALDGVRSLVAVGGGIAIPPVLGSRSTDTLGGIGPPPLRAGDVLPIGAPSGPPAPLDVGIARHADPVLRVVPGPRADWVTDAGWRRLHGAGYTVDPDSDRVALRLVGPAVERARTAELASEGIVLGALQLPPSGQPLVFLHDHPVTGGYPVIGVVEPADLPVCAQARPGTTLRLEVVDRV